MTQPKTSQEYQNFDQTMRELMTVPHTEIKAKLDAEKKAKKRKKEKHDGRVAQPWRVKSFWTGGPAGGQPFRKHARTRSI